MRSKFIVLLICVFQTLHGQLPVVPLDLPAYEFIRYHENRFDLVQDNAAFQSLFNKFDSLILVGQNQIRIVHIGGSHIQADIYTHHIRQEMQSFYPGILGARGFFFPYKIAQTNSPSNLWTQYTGKWLTSKNTQPAPEFALGVSGITSELVSDSGSISIVARYDTLQNYDFNRVRLFCNVAELKKIPVPEPANRVKNYVIDQDAGFIQYNLTDYADTLRLVIFQDTLVEKFRIQGISLENDDPGVVYNTIGVNGAMLKSYLQCQLFSRQLTALHPDWVIISIGTNEGNTRNFDKAAYRQEYLQLLDSIRQAVPAAAILLTVPNDSYLQKRYINHNTAVIREVIVDIAKEQHCGVWDFYTVMGGLNSAKSWYDSGLMGKDHIHFNKPGYILKGDLFFSAFTDSWNQTHAIYHSLK